MSEESHASGAPGTLNAQEMRLSAKTAGTLGLGMTRPGLISLAAYGLLDRATMDDFVMGMAGSGGDGIVSAGESLISAAAYEGYHAMMTKSFGSQVRGGESSCRVRLSTARVQNPGGTLDVAIALNWEDFLKFGAELPVSGDTVATA